MGVIQDFSLAARFAARAVSKDSTRHFMRRVEVEEDNGSGVLVATDGRRLHVAGIPVDSELAAGDSLEIVRAKKRSVDYVVNKVHGYIFPNWRGVVPDGSLTDGPTIDLTMDVKREGYSQEVCKLIQSLPPYGGHLDKYRETGRQAAVNLSFVEDLAGYVWKTAFTENGQTALFTALNDEARAVVALQLPAVE